LLIATTKAIGSARVNPANTFQLIVRC